MAKFKKGDSVVRTGDDVRCRSVDMIVRKGEVYTVAGYKDGPSVEKNMLLEGYKDCNFHSAKFDLVVELAPKYEDLRVGMTFRRTFAGSNCVKKGDHRTIRALKKGLVYFEEERDNPYAWDGFRDRWEQLHTPTPALTLTGTDGIEFRVGDTVTIEDGDGRKTGEVVFIADGTTKWEETGTAYPADEFIIAGDFHGVAQGYWWVCTSAEVYYGGAPAAPVVERTLDSNGNWV